MEISRAAMLLFFFVVFSLCSLVHSRVHHHHGSHKHGAGGLPAVSTSEPPVNIAPRPVEHPPAVSPPPAAEPAPAPAPAPAPSRRGKPPAPAPSIIPPPPAADSPPVDATVFNVRSFGAAGDGVTDDTRAFKLAWVAACQAGSGTLLVPRGYFFMINSVIFLGPCRGGIRFQVEGTMVPPDGPDSWPANISRRQWLVFYRADGLTMNGGGLIDGRGEKWWSLPCKPHRGVNGTTLPGPCDSPVALRFFQSANLTVRDVKVRNSPQFHFRFDGCRNVTVDSVAIDASANSPNTDGIHVENSDAVQIHNSVVSNGDDCVSIGAGSFNIDVYNVTCVSGHGISIGSLGKMNSRACVRNVTVSKAIIRRSDNGVRIKTWQGGTGSVSSVVFEDIHMDRVRNPIIVDQYYCLGPSCSNQTAAVSVSDVAYSKIRGTYDVRSPPMHFGCSDTVPCTNITLTEVELLPAVGDIILDPFCWSAYGVSQTLTIPPISCLMEGLPRTLMESDTDRCY